MRRILLVVLGLAFCLLAPMNRISATCSDTCPFYDYSCSYDGDMCGPDSDCANSCCCIVYDCGGGYYCETACGCTNF